MERNKEDRLGALLDIYGSDFSRWPVALSEEQKASIKIMPEYLQARQVDSVLEAVSWPVPSEGLGGRIMEQALDPETGREYMLQASIRPFMMPLKQGALFLSAFALSICFGFTSGAHLNTKMRQQMEYGYFSIGSAYAFAAPLSDGH
jgi:hypothetical protein